MKGTGMVRFVLWSKQALRLQTSSRCWLGFAGLLWLGLGISNASANAPLPDTLQYNRTGNMLESSPPPGKTFFLEGSVFQKEHTVRVYYARALGNRCPRLRIARTVCPAPEASGRWGCQEWRRGRYKSLGKFKVLIPRLRHAFSRYCFRVAYYETLEASLVNGLVRQLFRKLQTRIKGKWERISLDRASSRGAIRAAQRRRINFLRGNAPSSRNLPLLRKTVNRIVERFIEDELVRYISSIRAPKRRRSLRKFLRQEAFKFGLAYLRSRSTHRRFYYLARYILQQQHMIKMVGDLTQKLQQTSNSEVLATLNRRPIRGTKFRTLLVALQTRFTEFKALNFTLFEALLYPEKNPRFAAEWSRFLSEACRAVRRSHLRQKGYRKFNRWRQKMLMLRRWRGKGGRKPVPRSYSGMEALSCYRVSPTPIRDIVSNKRTVWFRTTRSNDFLRFLFLFNTRINLYDYIDYLRRATGVHQSFRLYEKQLRKTRVGVLGSIGDYLSNITMRQSNLSSPVSLKAQQYFEYYMSTDVGFAGALVPGFDSLQVKVFPYIGVHVYFAPVANSIPLQVEDGFLRRFSVFVGLTIMSFELQNNSVNVVGALGTISPMLGFGIRLTDFVRFNVGGILYVNRSLNPLVGGEQNLLAVTGFVSLSIDANLVQIIAGEIRKARNNAINVQRAAKGRRPLNVAD